MRPFTDSTIDAPVTLSNTMALLKAFTVTLPMMLATWIWSALVANTRTCTVFGTRTVYLTLLLQRGLRIGGTIVFTTHWCALLQSKLIFVFSRASSRDSRSRATIVVTALIVAFAPSMPEISTAPSGLSIQNVPAMSSGYVLLIGPSTYTWFAALSGSAKTRSAAARNGVCLITV